MYIKLISTISHFLRKRSDLELVFGRIPILGTHNLGMQIQERQKKKANVLHKNKNLPHVILFSQLNIESEHINTVNKTKTYHRTLIFSCFPQYLDKKSRRIRLTLNLA